MMTTSDAFFIFRKFWIFGLLVGVKGKGQKMAQNDKKKERKIPLSISGTVPHIIVVFGTHV